MRKIILLTLFLTQVFLVQSQSMVRDSSRVTLPNGWHLSPVGSSLPLGDLPLNIAVAPSKRYMAVTNNGQSVQSLQLIDVKNEKVLYSEVIPKSWYGLKFSADGKFLYAS